MHPRSFLPLVGGLLPFLLFPLSVYTKPMSFPVTVRGGGVRFINGPLTAENVGVSTADNTGYFANITLGGVELTVNLDTGSADLVIIQNSRNINLDNATDIQTSEAFGKGEAVGNVAFADLQIGDFTIQSQAFFNATQAKDLGSSGDGILGMSFNAPSAVLNALAKAFGQDTALQVGQTPMPALFSQQPDLPRSFDVALGRTDGLGDVADGLFLIGAHDDNFQQVANAPALTSVSTDHWSVVLDAMNINGKPFQFNQSRIQGVPDGKVAAVLDTGFSFPPLPPPAVDAIYSGLEGAVFDHKQALWVVPCNSSVQLSFVFGGQEFFVHPLDVTFPVAGPFGPDPSTNSTICVNTFQYLTLDPTEFVGFDIVLGDAFLRNVYASFNYGDENTPPFVQMVSTNPDPNAAQQQFAQSRAATLAQLPPQIDPAAAVKQDEKQPAAPTNGSGSPGVSPSGPAQAPNGASAPTSAFSSGSAAPQQTTSAQDSKPTDGKGNGAGRRTAMGVGALSSLSFLVSVALL
ncbi:acid protease [Trametes polyzona]|nr:acid protease [Trametes polyzona]